MISGPYGHEIRPFGPSERIMVLDSHFHGDFDRNGAAVSIEYSGKPPEVSQAGSLPSSIAGSWVSPPNITWDILSICDFAAALEHRVVVAMNGAPPGRHALDKFRTVLQYDPAPVRFPNLISGKWPCGGSIGMPQMFRIEPVDIGFNNHIIYLQLIFYKKRLP